MTISRFRRAGGALALGLNLGLSACITVDPPVESDEEGARRSDEDEDTSSSARAKKLSASKKKPVVAGDAGVDASPEESADDEAMDESDDTDEATANATRDGGMQATASQDGGMQSEMMDEQADDDTEIDEGQSTYCGILRTTVRVCNGSLNTDYAEGCVDDATDCLSLLPPDELVEYSEYCYTRTEYEVFAGAPQVGRCSQFDAYWKGEVECLLDKHCGEGELCEGNACVCPDGAACVCPNCGPQPLRCDGDVLVEMVGGGPCDENRECVYEEQRTDCTVEGLVCDESSGCVEPSTPPPPPPPSPSGVPGGPGG